MGGLAAQFKQPKIIVLLIDPVQNSSDPIEEETAQPIENDLGDYARQLEASARFNSAMRQAKSRRHALEILLNLTLEAFSADIAGVYDLKGSKLIYNSGLGLTIDPPDELSADSSNVLGRSINSDCVLFFDTDESSEEDCDFCGFLLRQKMKSLLVIPLRTTDDAIGVWFIALRHPISLTANVEQLLSTFSEAAGNTLQRFMVMEELEHNVAIREKELGILYKIMTIAGETGETQTLLDQSLDTTLQGVGCSTGVIHLYDPYEKRLKIIIRKEFPDELLTFLELSSQTDRLWMQVFNSQKRVQYANIPIRSFPENPSSTPLATGYLGFPIRAKNISIGVLSLFGDPEHLLDPTIVQIVSSVTDQLGLAYENVQLRKQAENAVVLQERQRLARNLHDSVSQSLYALVISADVSKKLLRLKDYPHLREQLSDIGKVAIMALKEMRLMLFELRPSFLGDEGLIGALELRLNTVERRAGIDANLIFDEPFKLPPFIEQEVYHIAIEGLNNSLKHAEATNVVITMKVKPRSFWMEIQDNGIGFDYSNVSATGGIGLSSMKERTLGLSGKVDFISNPGSGTIVHLEIPIDPERQ